MKQTDFRGERGAYHIECHNCGADVHLIGWNRIQNDEAPEWCPYCGNDNIWQASEVIR